MSGGTTSTLVKLGSVVLFVVLVAAAFVLLGWLGSGSWWPWGRQDGPDPVVAAIGAVAIGGVIIGVIRQGRRPGRATSFGHTTNDSPARVASVGLEAGAVARLDQVEAQLAELARRPDGSVAGADRWDQLVHQMGDSAPTVRLAGVMGMADLVDDFVSAGHTKGAQRGLDVLCGYLRMSGADEAAGPGDREVRQTIVREIAIRLRPESTVPWGGLALDFTGADLTDGRYVFDRAAFTTGVVSFSGAKFGGVVSFERCAFEGATVVFDDADLANGVVSFAGSQIRAGSLAFDRATFAGTRVSFARTTMAGGALLMGSARFLNGSVFFPGARFEGGHVSLRGAAFEGTRISFDSAVFAGGQVSFGPARIANGSVSGPWGQGQPPMSWPAS
ncbi:MAG: pentapeptide repeat-containing protein [Nostocoides sp.]